MTNKRLRYRRYLSIAANYFYITFCDPREIGNKFSKFFITFRRIFTNSGRGSNDLHRFICTRSNIEGLHDAT
ncbi:Uncharacterised protein [Enterobacter cloacae]|nr:Uncharacterised protein [Enterobacter cloacae]